jgi:hypothetical protein
LATAKRCEDPRVCAQNRKALCNDVARRFRLNVQETKEALKELRVMGEAQRVNQRKVRLP